uniref:RxLR effector candidate protein n=2 Tax=Hyaloperonospora arabidopsidis (strain Emoy2) TaxID=559515 RepID=M4BRN9_HYAAE
MTKCSLLLVPFLVAIAVSDALPARAAGTLPQSATSVQDKATESTVSGKRALQSKEDTKGAADEERALNRLQSVPEWLSTMTKSITNWTARTWSKAASKASELTRVLLRHQSQRRHLRKMREEFDQAWPVLTFETSVELKVLKKSIGEINEKLMDLIAVIEAKKVAPRDFVRPSE